MPTTEELNLLQNLSAQPTTKESEFAQRYKQAQKGPSYGNVDTAALAGRGVVGTLMLPAFAAYAIGSGLVEELKQLPERMEEFKSGQYNPSYWTGLSLNAVGVPQTGTPATLGAGIVYRNMPKHQLEIAIEKFIDSPKFPMYAGEMTTGTKALKVLRREGTVGEIPDRVVSALEQLGTKPVSAQEVREVIRGELPDVVFTKLQAEPIGSVGHALQAEKQRLRALERELEQTLRTPGILTPAQAQAIRVELRTVDQAIEDIEIRGHSRTFAPISPPTTHKSWSLGESQPRTYNETFMSFKEPDVPGKPGLTYTDPHTERLLDQGITNTLADNRTHLRLVGGPPNAPTATKPTTTFHLDESQSTQMGQVAKMGGEMLRGGEGADYNTLRKSLADTTRQLHETDTKAAEIAKQARVVMLKRNIGARPLPGEEALFDELDRLNATREVLASRELALKTSVSELEEKIPKPYFASTWTPNMLKVALEDAAREYIGGTAKGFSWSTGKIIHDRWYGPPDRVVGFKPAYGGVDVLRGGGTSRSYNDMHELLTVEGPEVANALRSLGGMENIKGTQYVLGEFPTAPKQGKYFYSHYDEEIPKQIKKLTGITPEKRVTQVRGPMQTELSYAGPDSYGVVGRRTDGALIDLHIVGLPQNIAEHLAEQLSKPQFEEIWYIPLNDTLVNKILQQGQLLTQRADEGALDAMASLYGKPA